MGVTEEAKLVETSSSGTGNMDTSGMLCVCFTALSHSGVFPVRSILFFINRYHVSEIF